MTDQEMADSDGIDSYQSDGLLCVLRNQRMAEPDEHPAEAYAFDLELYASDADADSDPKVTTTYTAGIRVNNPADAKRALASLAADAASAQNAGAPTDTTDLTDADVRDAVDTFHVEYGYEGAPLRDLLDAYAVCVEARAAFEAVGADPSHVRAKLDA